MIVMVTTVKGKDGKGNIFGFCSDCNNGNGKVNKRRTICEKLVGIGSVMENYAGCGSSTSRKRVKCEAH